jgi:hypothetical protein
VEGTGGTSAFAPDARDSQLRLVLEMIVAVENGVRTNLAMRDTSNTATEHARSNAKNVSRTIATLRIGKAVTGVVTYLRKPVTSTT